MHTLGARCLLLVALGLPLACSSSGDDGGARGGDDTAATADQAEAPDAAGSLDWGATDPIGADGAPLDTAGADDPGTDPWAAPDLAPDDVTTDHGASPDTGGGGTPWCKAGTQFVYVVNEENHLMRFDVPSLTFKDLGTMACETGWLADTPFSMAIDRQAVAWVLYGDGKLFKVSTEDASCQPTSFAVGQEGFTTFGMGFATDVSGGFTETLYVSNAVYGAGSSSLGTLSFPALTLTEIAPTESGIGSAELSGNGLGELWAFFPNGSLVAQVDKATGALWPKIPLPAATISDARAWAFATWGGDFYLFFAGQLDSSSSVYRVKKDGTFETLLTDTGWNITGAGVSSCAPTAPTN